MVVVPISSELVSGQNSRLNGKKPANLENQTNFPYLHAVKGVRFQSAMRQFPVET
jgi:hypothetical protein